MRISSGYMIDPVKSNAIIYLLTPDQELFAYEHDCQNCSRLDCKTRNVLENESALNARVFQFPTSAVKLNGRKINYYDFLMKAENAGCNAAVKRIYGRLDVERIKNMINKTPYISSLQKEFYIRYISARASLILAPAYEMILAGGQNQL